MNPNLILSIGHLNIASNDVPHTFDVKRAPKSTSPRGLGLLYMYIVLTRGKLTWNLRMEWGGPCFGTSATSGFGGSMMIQFAWGLSSECYTNDTVQQSVIRASFL